MPSNSRKRRKKTSFSKKKSQSYQCASCNQTFYSKTDLFRHGEDKPDDHPCNNFPTCVHCERIFYNQKGLDFHYDKSDECANQLHLTENFNTVDPSSTSNFDNIDTYTEGTRIITTATNKDPSSELNIILSNSLHRYPTITLFIKQQTRFQHLFLIQSISSQLNDSNWILNRFEVILNPYLERSLNLNKSRYTSTITTY